MHSLNILVEHEFGDIVYLKADNDCLPRIVVQYLVTPGNIVQYELQYGSFNTTKHYGFEISKEKNLVGN